VVSRGPISETSELAIALIRQSSDDFQLYDKDGLNLELSEGWQDVLGADLAWQMQEEGLDFWRQRYPGMMRTAKPGEPVRLSWMQAGGRCVEAELRFIHLPGYKPVFALQANWVKHSSLPGAATPVDRIRQSLETVDQVGVATFRFSSDSGDPVLEDANPGFCNMSSWGAVSANVAPGEEAYADILKRKLLECRRQGAYCDFEFCEKTQESQACWLTHLQPLVERVNTVDRILCTTVEISCLKKANEVVRQREQLWLRAFEASGEGVWYWNSRDNLIFLSPIWKAMLGYSEEELSNTMTEMSGLVHPDDRETFDKNTHAMILGELQVCSEEYRFRAKDGSYRWLLEKGKVLECDEAGTPLIIVGTFSDITDRKTAEEAVKSTSDRLKMAAKAGNIGIWEIDLVNGTVQWDPKMYELYGQDPKTFVPSVATWRRCVSAEDGMRIVSHLNKARKSGKPFEGQFHVKRGDEVRYHKVNASVQMNDRNQIIRMIGVSWDVTDSYHYQEELKAANRNSESLNRQLHEALEESKQAHEIVDLARRRLEQMNQELEEAIERANRSASEAEAANLAKSAFLAMMSHEIRTPLNGVIGMACLLLESELTPDQQDYVDTIQKSGESLSTLLNDILDYSKIEAGQINLEKASLNLRECIEDALELQASRVGSKPVELFFDMPPSVPEIILGDVTRLRQILTNLIGNAVKFTEQGHIAVRVRMEEHLEDSRCVLHLGVEDTGIGIPPSRIGKLFRPFTQVDSSTTRKYGGTGLGLAICKRLAECMEGEAWVTSEEGKGSVFQFRIVVGLPDEQDVSECVFKPVPQWKGHPVLLCESNDALSAVLVSWFRCWGCEPMRVATQDAAIKYLEEREGPRLVIVSESSACFDIQAMQASLAGRKVPLGVLGGYGVKKDIPGVEFVLTKPLRVSRFMRHLRSIFDGVPIASASQGAPRLMSVIEGMGLRKPIRVLLVEDNKVNQKVTNLMLKQLGYKCVLAENGLEAVAEVKEHSYDLILMDCQMPEMDGYEATREIVRLHKEGALTVRPFIVALTANAMQGDREIAIEAGMNDYLTKPFKKPDLEEKLKLAAQEMGLA